MRTWGRAVVDVTCGLCVQRIPKGAPILRISLPALKRPLWRCAACVPGGAPPDLPALIEQREQTPITRTPIKSLVHTVDFKAKAAGDER